MEKNMRKNVYMFVCVCVYKKLKITLLYSRN